MGALKQGVNDLANGVNELVSGFQQLVNGVETLSAGFDTAESKASESLKDTKVQLDKLDGLPEFAAQPTSMSEQSISLVSAYDIASALFFISLSLWVGAFTLFVVFYSDRNQRFKRCDVHTKDKLKRTGCYMVVAIAQGVISGVILKWTLGLDIMN